MSVHVLRGPVAQHVNLFVIELKQEERTICVEDASNTDIHTILAMEAICQSLSHTLALIVAGTRSNRVHMAPAIKRISMISMTCFMLNFMLTSPQAVGEPRGHHKPLCVCSIKGKHIMITRDHAPEVLVIRKRALVRLARPSMFSVPMKDVLMVFTALN